MTNVACLFSEIKSAFAEVGLRKVDTDTMSQCVSFAWSQQVTPKQMATCWEAFSFNKNIKKLNKHTFPAYRSFVINDKHSVAELPNLRGIKPPSLASVTSDAKRFPASGTRGTARNVQASVSKRSGPFVNDLPAREEPNRSKCFDRRDAGKVVAAYNPHNLEAVVSRTTTSPRICLSFEFQTNVHESYRHMFTTLNDRANALDRHLVEQGEYLTHCHNLASREDGGGQDVVPLEGVGVPRQDKVCCIGRICNAAHEGRINSSSVLLEGSRCSSGGARVEVDLHWLKSAGASFSLFPGQIVAVEGMNPSGRKLVAHRILEGAEPEPLASTAKELLHYHHGDNFQGGQPLSLMAVSGPFTTRNNLSYEPLSDVMRLVKSHNPDLVIMTGPFVDVGHDAVRSGLTTLQDEDGEDIVVPYETFFANKVSLSLEKVYAEHHLHTQFVLVPSLEDATAEWVYPQPPMSDRIPGGKVPDIPGAGGLSLGSLGLNCVESSGCEEDGFWRAIGPLGLGFVQPDVRGQATFRRVHCVSNPCTLKINELVIGVTSTDTLFDVSVNETSANLEPGSRLVRISAHMLQQRSYYPLFPSAPSVNLDLKHMNKWSMPCKCDLLILPSKLMPFARTVLESTIVINPGRLSLATTGGTCAIMDVYPMKREFLENAGGDDAEVEHSLPRRTRVEIKRI